MTRTSNTLKGIIVFSIVLTFLIFGLYLISFSFLKLNFNSFLSPLALPWAIFAFICGMLSIGGRGAFPLITTVLNNKDNRKSRILVLSLSVITALTSVGFLSGFLGSYLSIKYANIHSIIEYIYVSLGILIYILSLSGLSFLKIEKIRLPNIFNKKGNSFDLFILGFVSNITDIFPITFLLMGVATAFLSPIFGAFLLLSFGLGKVFLIYSAYTISKFKIDTSILLSKFRNNINTYLNVASIIAATISIYLGFIFYFERVGMSTGSLASDFVFNGWLLIVLWLVPLWVYFFREQNRIFRSPLHEFHNISYKLRELEVECNDLSNVYNFDEKGVNDKIRILKRRIGDLAYESKLIESSIRHNANYPIRNIAIQSKEEEGLQIRLILNIVVTIAVVTILSLFVS